ncbi:hypothetical protein BU16DRAFT_551425 [Lophium mytilinum]|uniref:Mitochondrial K+-H+ exchange-related-domain-containing protein n=1 Tax=Lophium mytilinum TaxID=390894 RepID=A0A6A6QMP5_9PEZI|nr:hypothetical protein BU16DRAFT_551425 [Lophium mytilinum]
MRIFLLPISARHSLIYCQHISKPSSSHYSLFDRFVERVEAQARQTWVAWEKKPGGWKKKSTTIGNQLLKRIPYQEWGLKSIPPLSKKLRTNVVDGKVTDVEVLFPARFMTEEKVKETLERFALQGQLKHSDRMFWSYAGLPFAVPFALVPIIPNFPLFYLAFRAWSHWRAYNGSRHLELLLKKDAIIPSPSADLDKIYGADLIHQDGSSSGADQRLRTGRWKLKIETETKDIMILHPGMGELIGEHFRIPEMASLIERAIERLEKDIRGGKVDTTKLASHEDRPNTNHSSHAKSACSLSSPGKTTRRFSVIYDMWN